jgi:hypothetical protein
LRKLLTILASSTSQNSLASWFRRRRFALFQELISSLNYSPVTILDIGGWQSFWEVVGFVHTPHKFILLNIHPVGTRYSNFTSLLGDGRNLSSFKDKSIDVVFSNSVIEHLGTYEDQQAMAREVDRVGKKYYIQTPSFYFPIEPHFLFPFFHWLPFGIRRKLIKRFSLGFIERAYSDQQALQILKEFRLLKKSEMKALFPGATIYTEKFLGFTKSYIAIKY